MKRALDLLFSSVALIVLSPVLLVVALIIRTQSPGPALYQQVRVGRFGEPFKILKFRTMVVGADRIGTSVTTASDNRITGVGRFLRRSKLDELPQLVNVLAGEMSLVGPRPDVPEVVNNYSDEMRRILDVRPGLTSVASLDLADEESLLALTDDPDSFYLDVVVPAKVAAAMRHVDDTSVKLYLGVIAATIVRLIQRSLGIATEGNLTRELKSLVASQDDPSRTRTV